MNKAKAESLSRSSDSSFFSAVRYTDASGPAVGRSAVCAAAAAAASFTEGVALGVIVLLFSVFGSIVYALVRRFYACEMRPAVCAVSAAGFVTLADLFLQAFLPDISSGLGIYVLLIAVSFFFIPSNGTESRADGKENFGSCLKDGFFSGAVSLLFIIASSTVRAFLSGRCGISAISGPFGGFLIAGCLTALVQFAAGKMNTTGGKSPAGKSIAEKEV